LDEGKARNQRLAVRWLEYQVKSVAWRVGLVFFDCFILDPLQPPHTLPGERPQMLRFGAQLRCRFHDTH
jgi:hypothetical protein